MQARRSTDDPDAAGPENLDLVSASSAPLVSLAPSFAILMLVCRARGRHPAQGRPPQPRLGPRGHRRDLGRRSSQCVLLLAASRSSSLADSPPLQSVRSILGPVRSRALADGVLFAVMELCDGGPILKVRDGEQVTPYSEDEARNIFRQLVLGASLFLTLRPPRCGPGPDVALVDRSRLPAPQPDHPPRHQARQCVLFLLVDPS